MSKKEKRVVVVTGASGGIGRAIARALLKEGYTVACAYHTDRKGVEEFEREERAFLLKIDIRSRASIRAGLLAIHRRFKARPDIVINNAGIADEKPFEKITDADWDRMLETNLRGAFIMVQETLPHMQKNRWGRIVNIASIGGQLGGMRQVHYAAAKGGLINFTHSIARLYSSEGITSNAIAPGLVATPMIEKELRSKAGKQKLRTIPTGRITEPEEVAAGVMFLVSEEAGSITGQTLNINGGMLFS